MTPEEWREVREVFARARDVPPSERAALLDSACAGNRERRLEVESLLANSEESGGLLDGAPAAALFGEILSEADARQVGRRVGVYELVSRVGQGGMGIVYRARRADGQFEQTVAVKLVKRGMDTDSVLARFRQEREILARLRHPHIAQLYDGGATDDGLPYFVMELVDGEPLLEYCNRKGLSVAQRL